jgi:SAM-dependent methyltransferase
MDGSGNCYSAVNLEVLARVPSAARRVLDIGCGTGALGRALKESNNREVIGVNHSPAEARLAEACLDRVIVSDLDHPDFGEPGKFDCLICSHVLEHLKNPDQLLAFLRSYLVPNGTLIVALPNILHWKQRGRFLRGEFRYTVGGLMDSTHLRFFDWNTAGELVERAGYRIIERTATGNVPLPFFRDLMPRFAMKIDKKACALVPGLFGWQFIFVATQEPDNRRA